MTSLIVPINANVEKYINGIKDIASIGDAQIFVGITKSLADKFPKKLSNVSVTVYEDGSGKEEILNSMQMFLTSGKVIICRREISLEEYRNLRSSNAQISFIKQKKENKVLKILKMFWQKILKIVFGVKTFEGDISLIAFDSDLSEVLASAQNFSFATRVDRWKGVTMQAVEGKCEHVCIEQNKKNNAMLIIATLLPIIAAIAFTTCLALFVKLSILAGMFIALFDALCLAGSIFSLLILCFNLLIGQKSFKRAKIVEE